MSDHIEPLPDPVRVPLAELSSVIAALERLLEEMTERGDFASAAVVDVLIGSMARWAWDLLPEIDEDGYDE